LLSAAFYSLGHGGNDAQKTMGIIFVLILAVPGIAVAREPDPRPVPTVAASTVGLLGSPLGQGAVLASSSLVPGKPLIPTEVVLACHVAMGLGTLFGGWRIVKTMGQRLVKLQPVDGFCAEAGAASTLLLTIVGGIPVSTTHTITGSIVGVGTARYRVRAVRWAVAGRVVWAWILTIPGSALIAAASYLLIDLVQRISL
jgi:PiT family inorganic phosphate transporter